MLIRRTKRLLIRPLALHDYQAWKTAYSTMLPVANEWDRGNRPPTELTLAKFKKVVASAAQSRRNGSFYDLAIFNRETGELIGFNAIMDVAKSVTHSAYIGYRLFNRHWGKGYAKEAVTALIDIAFNDLKLHRVEAGIEPRNRRSILLARALGLRKEGLKKRVIFARGEWRDLVAYSATTEDFGLRWKGEIKLRAH